MYKNDLALNDLPWLKSHKTKSNQVFIICFLTLEMEN